MGFSDGSDGKESPAVQETQVQSLSGKPPGEGHGYPLQCSCLENPMDRGAWRLQSKELNTTEQVRPSLS